MLIPPLSGEGVDRRGGGELPSHCCVLRYYAVYLPSSERSRPGKGGRVLPGGGCSDDGKNSEPRMAEVGHMVQGLAVEGGGNVCSICVAT